MGCSPAGDSAFVGDARRQYGPTRGGAPPNAEIHQRTVDGLGLCASNGCREGFALLPSDCSGPDVSGPLVYRGVDSASGPSSGILLARQVFSSSDAR